MRLLTLQIIDVISGELLQEYCSTAFPEPLLLSTNEANIIFHSDSIDSDRGLQVYCSVEDGAVGCGGVYTNLEGQIHSPQLIQYPISCEYDINVMSGMSVYIDLQKYNLEADDCLKVKQ